MFNTLDLRVTLDKETYRTQMEALALRLRSLQSACWEKRLSVVLVLEGWAAAGKGNVVKQMVDCTDPRGFAVHPIWPPTAEEQQYPLMWRFWRKLPSRGKIGVFYHSWYTHVLEDRLFGRVAEADVPRVMESINAFERHLADDGTAIAKFWIHLSKSELKNRLEEYANDPLDSWRVRPEDWHQAKNYRRYADLAEHMVLQTSTGHAPWTLVEGNDRRWATVKVLSQVAARLTEALDQLQVVLPPPRLTPQATLEPTEPNLLAEVNLDLKLSEDEYKAQLKAEQIELRKLQLKIHKHRIPVLLVFEGWDAAGKGGAIKRLTDILDPRSYVVHAFSAPTDEEKAHHYLWRFWRRLPTAGTIGIFDRSWYGRVLVERVEGFAADPEWRRAYREINEFESQLVSAGVVLVKFWLHISTDEQLRRFQDREADPFKRHKLTDEDWRNREQWSLYEVAVNQMILRTNTPIAPWQIVAANDKYYARVRVIQTVIQAVEQQIQRVKQRN